MARKFLEPMQEAEADLEEEESKKTTPPPRFISDQEMANHSASGAAKSEQPAHFISDQDMEAHQGAQTNGAAQAGLEHFGDAATLGYLPIIQAGLEPLTSKLGDLLTGQNVSKDLPDYVQRRDENIQRMDEERRQYPKASAAGMIGGSVAGGLLISRQMPIDAVTRAGRIAQGGVQAGLVGLGANPGDVPGEVAEGGQANERFRNAALAVPLGVLGQSVAEGLTAAGAEGVKSAEHFASEKALQAAGAMKKDFTKIFDRKEADKLGSLLLDSKTVTPLATTAKIAERLSSAKDAAGAEVGHILQTVDTEAAPKINARAIAKELAQDPEIQRLTKIPGQEGVANQVKSYLRTLAKSGSNLNLEEAQSLRQGIDKSINFNRRVPEMSGSQPYLFRMRDAIARRMNDAVNAFDQQAGGTLETNRLKVANMAYHQLTQLEEMASHRAAGLAANRAIGLTDTIAAGTGANVGATIGHATGVPGGAKVGSVIGGVGGAAANKLGRTYGSSMMATFAHSVAAPALRATEGAGKAMTQGSFLPVLGSEMIADHGPPPVPNSVVNRRPAIGDAIQRRLNK